MHFYYPFFESDLFWIFHLVFSILFPVIFVIFLVLLIKKIMKSEKREPHEDTATEILKKRYARGEISKEEFEQIKRDLMD